LGISADVNVRKTKIVLEERLGIDSNVNAKPSKIILSENLGIDSTNTSFKPREPIDHTFVEVTTRQTSSSTTYVDIPGAVIGSSNLTPDDQYLLVFTALFDGNDVDDQFGIRAVHDSTEFGGSEMIMEPSTVNTHNTYTWFTVWDAVASEDVKLQFKTLGADTVGADQITIFAMNLDEDLTENTEWFFDDDSTSTTLSTAWSTTNNAEVTFTPTKAGNDWLVMTTSRMDVVSSAKNYESRIDRSGEATSTQPMFSQEGEDANDFILLTNMRVFNLGAASNTFTEQSRLDTTATTEARTHSGVFALNLNAFKYHEDA